jgi:hypothetical protein
MWNAWQLWILEHGPSGTRAPTKPTHYYSHHSPLPPLAPCSPVASETTSVQDFASFTSDWILSLAYISQFPFALACDFCAAGIIRRDVQCGELGVAFHCSFGGGGSLSLWDIHSFTGAYSPERTFGLPFQGFLITHIPTHGRTPLDEWSARRRDLYLHRTTQHINTRDKHPCPERDLNPRPQQPSGLRPSP